MGEIGKAVEIHWVPGHMGVDGNGTADEVAKEAVERVGIRYSERLVSFSHVGRLILERKWKEPQHYRRQQALPPMAVMQHGCNRSHGICMRAVQREKVVGVDTVYIHK